MSTFLVIMGVSGCGKTTITRALADRIPNSRFLEGDDFHPPENKEKMGAGVPLTDEDRWPWFAELNAAAQEAMKADMTAVLACSALKEEYREALFRGFDSYRLVFLKGCFELIHARMDARDHEYMTSTLLESQFATLEEPEPGENVLALPIELTPEEIVDRIMDWIGDA